MPTEESIFPMDGSKNDPTASLKDVTVFKTSALSGNVGVIDVGDRAKTYTIDLDEINSLAVLGKMSTNNPDLADIAKIGQDGKRFQNNEIGLIDNETGEVDAELAELIRVAATGESEMIHWHSAGSDNGTTYVEIAIGGKWSTDILRFEGDQLNDVLADLSDIPAVCESLPNSLDMKNKASQIAVFDYSEFENDKGQIKVPKFFAGDDGNVDSQAVKDIYGGSKMEVDEAIELVQYALSEEGQSDEGISVDFNGAGVIVEIGTQGDSSDTFIFKGDAFFAGLNTTQFDGKNGLDLKNNVSQIGVFDFNESAKFFIGDDGNVDSTTAKAIIGGSKLEEDEAAELVALALSGTDENVRYLGGDEDSAVIAIDASGDSTDIFFISGDQFDFI